MSVHSHQVTEAPEPMRFPFVGGIYSREIRSFSFQLALAFMIALITFLVLRSSDFLAVDGALRALQVYYLDRPFLHPNSHLLYAVNLYVWSTMLRLLGIVAHDQVTFLRLAEAMNAIAAAACLTIFYGLLHRLTNRRAVAALATLGFGFSSAFLAHATSSAEPMVGLLWSEVSVVLAIYGCSRPKKWPLVAGGLLLALAMATYQSMVLFGVPIVLMLWLHPSPAGGDFRTRRSNVAAAARFVTGFALGISIIYGTAYYLAGTRTLAGMIARFLQLDGSGQVYSGVNIMKLASALPGLAVSLFPILPPECGFRCLSDRHYLSWVPTAALAVAVAGICLVTLVLLARKLWTAMTATEKLATGSCAVGFLTTVVPVICWMPTYDKLWLQPLSCLFLGGGLLLSVAWRESNFRYLLMSGCALVAAIAVSNIALAVLAKTKPTPYLNEAREVAAVVAPQDLIVGDWNNIFVLYQAFWAPRGNSFNVPTVAIHEGLQTIPQLAESVAQTMSSGGQNGEKRNC